MSGPISVPLLDLKPQYEALATEIDAAVAEVIISQYFILGPSVESFEQKTAEYCNTEHGIGVSSGTDALIVAMMAMGIGEGDEVITSPYTFSAPSAPSYASAPHPCSSISSQTASTTTSPRSKR